MTDAGTAQDCFISSCQVKIIYWLIWCLKSVLGTPTLTRGKSKADLAAEFAESAFSLPLMPTWLGTQQKVMTLLATLKRHTFINMDDESGNLMEITVES